MSKTTDSPGMTDGEKLMLAVIAFLVIKGLIDASEAQDRDRVQAAWKRFKSSEKPRERGLFGTLKDDLFG